MAGIFLPDVREALDVFSGNISTMTWTWKHIKNNNNNNNNNNNTHKWP